jgi:hypothetical protein
VAIAVSEDYQMPSRFSGMDPFLETPSRWPLFQQTFIACLREALDSSLTGRYRTRSRERLYGDQGRHREEYIEIVGHGDEGLVTVVDVASPSNKTTAIGREAYLYTRQQARAAKANFVDIDLALLGQPMFEYSRDGLPAWDYAVTVLRASNPERFEIYTSNLQKRLPRFKVPLSAGDRETVLDLQTIFGRCFDRADFDSQIDYQEAPAALHDRIAIRAYELWQYEGCPNGRDREHWYKALEELIGAN